MPRQITQYRIFIGSPGGLHEEREAFRRVLATFNQHHGEPNGIVFAPVGWEDTLAGVGRPQELINEDLRQCDFAVFLLHDRWGSSSGNGGKVGTEEEWQLAQELHAKKTIRKICLFFKHVDKSKLDDPGPQLRLVLSFKEDIEKSKKHLFRTYGDMLSYCTALEGHLAGWMHEIVGTTGKELKALLRTSADEMPPPVSEAGPSFSFWLSQSTQLSIPGAPGGDLGGARYCADAALKLADTDAEWADAEHARAMALENPTQSFDSLKAIADRFLDSRDPVLQGKGVRALVSTGIALGQLGRGDEEIAVYDDVVARFGAARDLVLRVQVARALVKKGFRLQQLDRNDEAFAVYDDVVARFGATSVVVLREFVARAVINKGNKLGKIGRGEDEIAVYDAVVARFGAATEAALHEQVARALVNKAGRLAQLDRSEDEIAVYDDLIRRFGAASDAALRRNVARALANKAGALGRLGQSEQAIAVYDSIVGRFGAASEPALRDQVAHALVKKGIMLEQVGRSEAAIAVCDNVIARFGAASDAGLPHWVERATELRETIGRT